MSNRELNRRLERLFADVDKQEVSPKAPAPRQAEDEEAPKPGLPGARGESGSNAAKSILSAKRAAPDPGPLAAAERGVISSAFRQDEKRWATLRLVDESASHAWSDQEQMLVEQVADQLSLALENARLFQETKNTEEALQHQNERLAAAAEIGRLVTSTLDIDTIFRRTVTMVSERFGFYHAALFLIDDSGNHLVLREATGEPGAKLKSAGYGLPVNANSMVGKVALTGEFAVVNNTSADPTHVPNPLLPKTRAECAIPLRVGNRIIGALDIQATTVDAFAPDDLSVMQILGDQVAIAIDNARSYELAQQAVKEMRELDRVKTQFLANMSHELRTPLNSIIGFSRVILKGIDGPISEVQRQDITAIYGSGQHLLGLINDVLDLAKIEAGKMDISLEETSLREMISSVMSTASGLVKDKPIRLTQRVPEDLPSARADPIRVRQVLLNLLSNASKFTDQGEITVEASVEARPDGTQQVRVSVSDTGPGISAEDQKKLFQAFSQVDDSPTRKTGGSGLGLSISQELVQLQGGRIGVESAPGKGSTFFFTLPIYRAGAERTAEGDRKLVLAVDDDPQVLKLYERSLGAQGYQVLGVTDPTKAREMALQVKPFAITLDIMMPGYDGWQVLAELKRDADTRAIPVIVCSILEQQERGLRLGAADYVLKPILGDGLLNALDRLRADRRVREVLIIDDDGDSLRLMEKLLENQAGCKVALAQGGAEGWKHMADHAPDVVVLDLLMPDLDGFVLLQKMRETPELRQVPVIIVSDTEITSDQRVILTELGQRAIMKGPGNEQALVQAVNQALHPARS